MATYREIQDWVRSKHGFLPKTCWIAHCKEISNIPIKKSHRRLVDGVRQVPCPIEKQPAILAAFHHFNMLE